MQRLAYVFGLCLITLTLVLAYGYHEATRPPVVVRQSIGMDDLPPGTRFTIALIADIHFGFPDMDKARLDDVVRIANEQKPDLTLLAGDYFGGKIIDKAGYRLEQALGPLAGLKAPLGVFAVSGNHDSLVWLPKVMGKQKNPIFLDGQHVDIGPVVIVGAPTTAKDMWVQKFLDKAPSGKPAILLVHEGDRLLHQPAPQDRTVLTLGAHTHGGQVILPFLGPVMFKLRGPTACVRGLCQVNGWPLFVTSGVGTSWMPIRIGVPPEIVLIEIYSTGRKSGTER